jgi:cell division protein FtsN
MRRIIRIAIYAAIILGLYFWVMTMMKGCDSPFALGKQTAELTDTMVEEPLDTMVSGLDTTSITEDQMIDGELNYDNVDQKVKEIEKTVDVPAVASGKVKNEKPTPKSTSIKPTEKPKEVSKTPPPSESGKYMVMAGSYLLRENADQMVKKLQKMGYNSAKVVVFSASQYHSVVAASYAADTKAQSVAAELKRKGIDSFVKSKQ